MHNVIKKSICYTDITYPHTGNTKPSLRKRQKNCFMEMSIPTYWGVIVMLSKTKRGVIRQQRIAKLSFDVGEKTDLYNGDKQTHMESTKKLITPLLDLGLNKYEAKVYLSLITEGVSTAKNVSNITGIPYGKVYEIINTLANKGFCMILPSKPMKCQAVSPRQAMEKTKDNLYSKLAQVEKHIIKQLDPFYQKSREFSEPKGAFWVLNGRSNILRKIDELLMKAKDSISILTTENGLKRIVIHKEGLLNAQKRNASIKIAGPISKENKEDVQSLLFCDVRHINKAPCQLISIDGNESLIVDAVPDDDNIVYGRDYGVWITNASVTHLLEDAFLSKYSRAKTYQQ